MHETTMNQQDLAALLQITPRTLATLTQRGIVPREPDGAYCLGKAIPAYIAHRSGEWEYRQQRIQLLKQHSVKQAQQLRRQAGELITRAELQRFVDIVDDVVTRLWQALTSHIFHGLVGQPERLQITHAINLVGLDELAVLRQRLKAMVDGVYDDLKQEERLEEMNAILAGEAPPKRKAKK